MNTDGGAGANHTPSTRARTRERAHPPAESAHHRLSAVVFPRPPIQPLLNVVTRFLMNQRHFPQFPITAPLPVATISAEQFSPLYSPHWSLAPPDFIIDPQAGRVGQMQLDLAMIARSSIDKACLLQFLLARTYAASVILEVRRGVEQKEQAACLAWALSRIAHLRHGRIAAMQILRVSHHAATTFVPFAQPSPHDPSKPRIDSHHARYSVKPSRRRSHCTCSPRCLIHSTPLFHAISS